MACLTSKRKNESRSTVERRDDPSITRAEGLIEQALAAAPGLPQAHFAKAQLLRGRGSRSHKISNAKIAARLARPCSRQERHPALQWMYHSVEHHQKLLYDHGNTENDQLGFSAAWIRFAYDLYTIRDNAKLERRMKLRLLSNKDFQGARHELRTAAVAVAAGFQIEFENEKDNAIGHAEFIGTDRSGLKIAVEAKSRHRHGVQGFQGGKQLAPGSKVDIRNIILDAYKKKKTIPMYAFVDANLPPAADKEQLQSWLAEIHATMADLEKEGYADACPVNTLFICNDPSHYVGNRQINNETDRLWFMRFEAKEPRVPHPTADMTARLYRAYTQRITPPGDIPDFNSP